MNLIRSYDDQPSIQEIEQQEPIVNTTQAPPDSPQIPRTRPIELGHLPLPELDPLVVALADAEATYEYWMRKTAMRYLQEFDIPDDLYIRPQATVNTFHAPFPLPDRLYKKWCEGIRI